MMINDVKQSIFLYWL